MHTINISLQIPQMLIVNEMRQNKLLSVHALHYASSLASKQAILASKRLLIAWLMQIENLDDFKYVGRLGTYIIGFN